MSFKKVKLVSIYSQSRDIKGVFYTLTILVEKESGIEEDVLFSRLGFQQSAAVADDIVQAI